MKDTAGYRAEVLRVREKYKGDIQVYLGVEEDAFYPLPREDFDYIIGSCHYLRRNGKYFPIDSGRDYFKRCVEAFDGDILTLAEQYYSDFCDYIFKNRPHVIGHFDLITKFDEVDGYGFLESREYNAIAEKYAGIAADSGCLFEVNTGAISRGYRSSPYPAQNLLHVLKNKGCGLLLSSDSHAIETLSFGFDEAKALLRDVGFEYIYALYDGEFKKVRI
jgi:histidinol-phosphatase (PHP family)